MGYRQVGMEVGTNINPKLGHEIGNSASQSNEMHVLVMEDGKFTRFSGHDSPEARCYRRERRELGTETRFFYSSGTGVFCAHEEGCEDEAFYTVVRTRDNQLQGGARTSQIRVVRAGKTNGMIGPRCTVITYN